MKIHFKKLLFLGIVVLTLGKGINVDAISVDALENEIVVFEDSTFCAQIASKTSSYVVSSDCNGAKTITYTNQEDLENIAQIRIYDIPFTSIEGIERFTGLRELNIQGADLIDISPLQNLTNINLLNLSDNSIEDITPLAGLTSLTGLDLDDNLISDINPLKDLSIDFLSLNNNLISNISVLSNLKETLMQLFLDKNLINDISVLKDLTKLDSLGLRDNNIKNISALKDLTELWDLDLRNNKITNVNDLSGLTKLTHLDLSQNFITDPEALESVDKLYEITSNLSVSSQKFDVYLEKGDTYQLPKIFLLAMDEDSEFYSEDGLRCDYGCTIDDNGLVTITDSAEIGTTAMALIRSGYASYSSFYFHIVENKEDYFENENKTTSLKVLKDTLDGTFTLVAFDIIGELNAEQKSDLNEMLETGDLLAVFEIHVEDSEGEIVELPNGSYQIRIKMTDEMKKYENFKMAYFNLESESIEEVIETSIDGEYIVFTTTHLSVYVMEGNLKNPKTGDIILIIAGLLVLATSGMFITYKKIKSNN